MNSEAVFERVEAPIADVAEAMTASFAKRADVVYHLLVLSVAKGVACDEARGELERRFGAANAINGDSEKG